MTTENLVNSAVNMLERVLSQVDAEKDSLLAYSGLLKELEERPEIRESLKTSLSRIGDELDRALRTNDELVQMTARLRNELAHLNVSGLSTREMEELIEKRGRLLELNRTSSVAFAELNVLLTEFFVTEYMRINQGSGEAWKSTWLQAASRAKEVVGESDHFDDRDRQLMRLRYEYNLSQDEIARLLGTYQPIVATRLGRLDEYLEYELAKNRILALASDEGLYVEEETVPRRQISVPDIYVEAPRRQLCLQIMSDFGWRTGSRRRRTFGLYLDRIRRVVRSRPIDRLPGESTNRQVFTPVMVSYSLGDDRISFYAVEDMEEILGSLSKLSPADEEPSIQQVRSVWESVEPSYNFRELLRKLDQDTGTTGA